MSISFTFTREESPSATRIPTEILAPVPVFLEWRFGGHPPHTHTHTHIHTPPVRVVLALIVLTLNHYARPFNHLLSTYYVSLRQALGSRPPGIRSFGETDTAPEHRVRLW